MCWATIDLSSISFSLAPMHNMAMVVAAKALFMLSLYSSASHAAPFKPFSFTPPCPPGFVAFGDSSTDTGNLLHIFANSFVPAGFPPYGRTFFHRPRGRYCDGRLLVDFIAASFGYPFLHPYLDSIGADFRHGINFAVAGATANLTIVAPFTLPLQVDEFILFKKETLLTVKLSSSASRDQLPEPSFFKDALYIVEFGINDLREAILNLNLSIPQIESTIVPQAVASIDQNAKRLYAEGARNFLFVGTLAQGCSADALTILGATNKPDELDSLGCLKTFNNLCQLFNSQLQSAIRQLKQQLPDAAIVFADYYNASLAIFSNPSKYNFKPTLDACCGIGGKYNYDLGRQCGVASVKVCPHPSIYINWDGVHSTDAFHRTIAKSFLSGEFLDPPINLITTCSLLPI